MGLTGTWLTGTWLTGTGLTGTGLTGTGLTGTGLTGIGLTGRRLMVDAGHLGTPAAAWAGSPAIRALRPLIPPAGRRVLVVAPHPDDEVLGAGGLMTALARLGNAIEILAVTDGEASHPGSVAAAAVDLAARRHDERAEALRRLIPAPIPVTRLGLPDGAVAAHADRLRSAIATRIAPRHLVVAPWSADGHPDHDATGQAAARAAADVGADLVGYLVWAWHWARPDGDDLPWAWCRRLDLTRRSAARKRWAAAAYRTQVRPLGPDPADGPVLPAAVVRRSCRRHEVFVVGPGR